MSTRIFQGLSWAFFRELIIRIENVTSHLFVESCARGIGKKFPTLQVGWQSPVPPTLPVIRVFLLHTEPIAERFFERTAFKNHCSIFRVTVPDIVKFLILLSIGIRTTAAKNPLNSRRPFCWDIGRHSREVIRGLITSNLTRCCGLVTSMASTRATVMVMCNTNIGMSRSTCFGI